METFFLIAQVILGMYFVMAGAMHFMKLDMMVGYAVSKKLPAPKLATILSGLVLLLGGLGILFQYELTWSYGLLAGFLAVAAFTMHRFWEEKAPEAKMMNMVNFEKNLALASALVMLLVLQG